MGEGCWLAGRDRYRAFPMDGLRDALVWIGAHSERFDEIEQAVTDMQRAMATRQSGERAAVTPREGTGS